jgi:hypothetical protein
VDAGSIPTLASKTLYPVTKSQDNPRLCAGIVYYPTQYDRAANKAASAAAHGVAQPLEAQADLDALEKKCAERIDAANRAMIRSFLEAIYAGGMH